MITVQRLREIRHCLVAERGAHLYTSDVAETEAGDRKQWRQEHTALRHLANFLNPLTTWLASKLYTQVSFVYNK